MPARIDLVDGSGIRFRRLPASAGLSQTRVSWVVQDKLGFIWFGTQYGLNRYDGYKSKIFKHEPDRPETLSCVYVRSLLVDHTGTLWVGCDRFLDRFEPETETFAHYQIYTASSDQLFTPIDRIGEDHEGALWLATARGLYRFDPASGRTVRYSHDPQDHSSISANGIHMAAEDREGRLWIAGDGGLDEFDPKTGKVVRHAPLRASVSLFHEDESGLFWLTVDDPSCGLASWNPRTDLIKCHSINYRSHGIPSRAVISDIVEARNSILWFSSTGGLLKFDRVQRRMVRYHNDPLDMESLEADSLIFLYQDHEGDIWTCFQVAPPNFFSDVPLPFENFTYQRGSLANPLVTSIYEDHNGILWIGSMGGLNRIDRRSGKNIVPSRSGVGNEILSILEDRRGVLFCGTFHMGLQRIDRRTGKVSQYVPTLPSNVTNPIMQMIYDHDGNLWAAMYGGVGRFDTNTGRFVMYTPENQNIIQYQKINEDSEGYLWLGAQSGLHRFDPRTGQFKIYEHHPDNPKSLSDNRVNSVTFDHLGNLWVGTQDGLGRFDRQTETFKNYYEKDGLAGDVVSCIQEDKHGVLWMGTNNGLSSFNPQSQSFQNFSAADGLPGGDLTGWGACGQSSSGEMFFGGFSGATAFYPGRIANSSFVPRTVLTDFRLFGNSVPIGGRSPLKESITRTESITLSHLQNIFSIEFSALSFFNAQSNRYRYRLYGLDHDWREVGGDQRTASYTTLPAGTYAFEVQGATARGPWSEPGAMVRIEILPARYQTLWFRSICVAVFLVALWSIYVLRLKQLQSQFHAALEARVDERTRIARDLHDTLLQSFHGLMLQFQAVRNMLPGKPEKAERALDEAILETEQALAEGRDAIRDLRTERVGQRDLAELLNATGSELAVAREDDRHSPTFRVTVEGEPRTLPVMLQDEVFRIAREVIRNAFHHAVASRIEVEIHYGEDQLRLRIRDDGKGIDAKALEPTGSPGHWGIPGIRERAQRIGSRLEFWSEEGAGTEVELTVPATIAYEKQRDRYRFRLFRRARSDGQHS